MVSVRHHENQRGGNTLTCHEIEIIRCCLEELSTSETGQIPFDSKTICAYCGPNVSSPAESPPVAFFTPARLISGFRRFYAHALILLPAASLRSRAPTKFGLATTLGQQSRLTALRLGISMVDECVTTLYKDQHE